ncbi:MAG: hypothetical protein Q9218_005617 [Villophora microphyllina]
MIGQVCRHNRKQENGRKRKRQPDTDTVVDREPTKENFAFYIAEIFECFVDHVFDHAKVLHSAESLRQQLRSEVEEFLLAHVQQLEYNQRRSSETSNGTGYPPKTQRNYFDWVRSTSADHTSCPYSFVFWTCLISKPGRSCFANVKAKYLAQDMSRHLATMCRQYNDYGSIARNRAEGNLNSIDLKDFQSGCTPDYQETGSSGDGEPGGQKHGEALEMDRRKEDLFWLAEYERRCIDLSLAELAKECSEETMAAVRFFVRVTDLYGQIYVAKDIGIRTK